MTTPDPYLSAARIKYREHMLGPFAENPVIEQLLAVMQELSQAHDMESVGIIVTHAARLLTGADGAALILRDRQYSHYVHENTIKPLWPGRRMASSKCISGWVMMHAENVAVKDVFADGRIPAESYRATFVKSLAMVPIRRSSPLGVISVYWEDAHVPAKNVIAALQTLADTASASIQNARLYAELETRLDALEESNHELSRFAWAASHDLQEPLRTIAMQMELLERKLPPEAKASSLKHVQAATQGASRLRSLLDALLVHAQAGAEQIYTEVNLNKIVEEVCAALQSSILECDARITCKRLPTVHGNMFMLSLVFQNLISNALKFRSKNMSPQILVEAAKEKGAYRLAVKDNGIGIASDFHDPIFGLFKRLHAREEYAGSGVGLATCRKIIQQHKGRIWVHSAPGKGSVFYFTLPCDGFSGRSDAENDR